MDRRTFLKRQAQGLLWLSAGPALLSAAPAFAETAAPDVAVVKGKAAAATRAAVDMLGGMSRFVKPGNKVVIKPNMSFAKDVDSATNTHPEVVRELLIMCKEAGAAQVRILDHSLQNPEQSMDLSGIRPACDGVEQNLCHHLMNAGQYVTAPIPDYAEMRENAFMRDVLAADVLIACPVAKSHSGAGVSLSLKGQMGLIFDRRIMHSRYNLDSSIVDMNKKILPTLAVIDATRVLTTGGPGGPGKVITPGEIIASADPVAADATAVASYEWYGRKMQPGQVGHIRLAHERKLGRMDIENLVTGRMGPA
ncbi:MAG: DUF362 domain-containing protein [Desulfovibrio sp.]|jgi:uncharacterized protein (DUF362 family)|nr:DUF362 domain-containing protein [Desulfovibrio sp.]